jgi:hypothetical protein
MIQIFSPQPSIQFRNITEKKFENIRVGYYFLSSPNINNSYVFSIIYHTINNYITVFLPYMINNEKIEFLDLSITGEEGEYQLGYYVITKFENESKKECNFIKDQSIYKLEYNIYSILNFTTFFVIFLFIFSQIILSLLIIICMCNKKFEIDNNNNKLTENQKIESKNLLINNNNNNYNNNENNNNNKNNKNNNNKKINEENYIKKIFFNIFLLNDEELINEIGTEGFYFIKFYKYLNITLFLISINNIIFIFIYYFSNQNILKTLDISKISFGTVEILNFNIFSLSNLFICFGVIINFFIGCLFIILILKLNNLLISKKEEVSIKTIQISNIPPKIIDEDNLYNHFNLQYNNCIKSVHIAYDFSKIEYLFNKLDKLKEKYEYYSKKKTRKKVYEIWLDNKIQKNEKRRKILNDIEKINEEIDTYKNFNKIFGKNKFYF